MGNIEVESTPLDIIDNYFNDEDVKEQLDTIAIHLNEVSRGKWVGLNFFKRKSRIKKYEELKTHLDLLVMSKRAFSKKVGDILLYKITLNKDQRKKVLKSVIKELKESLNVYEKELEELNS